MKITILAIIAILAIYLVGCIAAYFLIQPNHYIGKSACIFWPVFAYIYIVSLFK